MTTAAPTTAERIRSACVRSGGAMLAVEGVEPASTPVHHLLDDGSFTITVPGEYAVAGDRDGERAVVEEVVHRGGGRLDTLDREHGAAGPHTRAADPLGCRRCRCCHRVALPLSEVSLT